MVLAYYDPLNRTYGVISVLEDVTDEANGFQFDSGDGFTNILLATHTGGGEGLIKLIDIVKGAVHTIAMADVVRLSTNDIDMRGIVRVDDDLVYAYNSSSTGATLQWDWDQYAGEDTHDGQPYVTSALWDFGVIEAKVLSSIRVECEPITSGWTVTVAYQLEGSGTWTDAGTLVEDDTGVTFAVSTGSSSVSFYNLRLRLTFSYAGSGSSSSLTPIVHHVEARAQLPGIVKVWNIQVDLSDDNSGAGPHKGSQKVENIQSAGDAGTVVVFKNGFVSASPNVFQSHDVVIDAYRIDLERPGEGYATLRLLERS